MPVFSEFHYFNSEVITDFAMNVTIQPPTDLFQWPQYSDRYNQEWFEEDVVPTNVGKHYEDFFEKWIDAAEVNNGQEPRLMVPKEREGGALTLDRTQARAVRRLNDEAYLVYVVELTYMVAKSEGIDMTDDLTRRIIIEHVHSAIQICGYRRDLACHLMNHMSGFIKLRTLEIEGMNYLNYLSVKASRYAAYTARFMIMLNTLTTITDPKIQRLKGNVDIGDLSDPFDRDGAESPDGTSPDIEYHTWFGQKLEYDPDYLIDLNAREREARERLQAVMEPLKPAMMQGVYQFPSEVYGLVNDDGSLKPEIADKVLKNAHKERFGGTDSEEDAEGETDMEAETP